MNTPNSMPDVLLKVDGEVERPLELTFDDLAAIDAKYQILDVSRIDSSRQGDAVTLAGLLNLCGVKPAAAFLGMHGTADDFHASIPLEAVRERGFFIYRLDGQPLPMAKGGPVRFYIPDHAACQTDDIDECANVKFLDHLELTRQRGFDNRPTDDDQHARLHQRQDNH